MKNKIIRISTGNNTGKVYVIDHDRYRHVPAMKWLDEAYQYIDQLVEVPEEILNKYKLGSSVPFLIDETLSQGLCHPSLSMLEFSSAMHPFDIRNCIASQLKGFGYEFGPGPRPISIPVGCTVSYVDLFEYNKTFASGSYKAIADQDLQFMPIDLCDSLDKLANIDDESCDFIIASHVIEHIRNPLGAIERAYDKLRPDGVLFLVIPEKNLIFDKVRNVTSIEHFIIDWKFPDRKRDLEHYFEWNKSVKKLNNWFDISISEHKSNEDIHYHTFTVESFLSILDFLKNITPWRKFEIIPPSSHELSVEFYAILRK